jgi:hypothetical protein
MSEEQQVQTAEGQVQDQGAQPEAGGTSILAGKTFTHVGADGVRKVESYDDKGALITDKPEEAGQQKEKTSENGESAETPAKDPEEEGKEEPEGEETEEAEVAKLTKKDDPKGVQERIKELVGQRRKAERETSALRIEIDGQKTELQSLKDAVAELMSGKKPDETVKAETTAPEIAKPERPAKPKEDDFASYGEFEAAIEKWRDEDLPAYYEALADWKADQKLEEYAASQRKAADSQRRAAEEAVHNQWVAEGAKKFKDFAEVVESDATLKLYTPEMMDTVNASEDVHALAYHLAKNPAELKRIAALSPIQQVREVTRIDLELQGKQKTETVPPANSEKDKPGAGITKRTTTVDEPIKPLSANGSAGGGFDSTNASPADVKRHLDAQERAKLLRA